MLHNTTAIFPKIKCYSYNLWKYIIMSSETYTKNSLAIDFKDFKFSPSKLLDLKVETNHDNYVRRYIKGVLFSYVNPTPLAAPKLVSTSEDVLTDIFDLEPSVVENEAFVEFAAGNIVIDSSTPVAHRYGGHQFGVWAGQLGDGRAILLGEYVNKKGERWEVQLKGSGKTPYSRDGDGRAVLRSSIREFLCSEAMYYLGIPTTRAGAIVVSEQMVLRDILYDGHPSLEPAAVVLRVAQSWFRIGSLEILAKGDEIELLRDLLYFIVQEHFPDIERDDNMIPNFMKTVFRRTCDLVVMWQSVGFTHGVLNTDNMSLLGLTIDYGPFGFMEDYDLKYVPNHSDYEGRYCYGDQIDIIFFNLLMLVKAVAPLQTTEQLGMIVKMLHSEVKYTADKITYDKLGHWMCPLNSKSCQSPSTEGIGKTELCDPPTSDAFYPVECSALDRESFSGKLGFTNSQPHLVEILIAMFKETKADFTMVFRELSENPLSILMKPTSKLWALKVLSKHNGYVSFIEKYKDELSKSDISDKDRMDRMCAINPRYILRNWMGQHAIDMATSGDYSEVNILLKILKNPFFQQEEAESRGYANEPPSWNKSICISCSS